MKSREAEIGDLELVKNFQSNNLDAFDILVVRYQDVIFNLCYRLLGDFDDADDCAQEVFIKAYRNLNGFKLQSSFSTWLHRIAINTCKNKISSVKRRIRKKMIRLNNTSNNDNGFSMDIEDNSYNPAEIYEKMEMENNIQKAINLLPEKEKLLIVLRDIEGKSYEELSSITGIKLGTVKSKLAKARQNLRDMLRGVL